MADRRVAFRIVAPQAQNVRLTGGDIPALAAGGGRGAANAPGATPAPNPGQMKKGDNGVWEVVLGPLDPGAYRYNFTVDGVTVIDPRNPSISESNTNVWSLVYVPGSDLLDTKNVPRGAVASVTYYSTALKPLPPHARLHAAGIRAGRREVSRCSICCTAPATATNAWTSVGRAGFILDNLIAAKKAKPMIVVMPAGHTTLPCLAAGGGRRQPPGPRRQADEFYDDFMKDIMPYVEKHYRVFTGRNAPRHRRPFHGRKPDLERRLPQPGEVRLYRRLQLRRDPGRRTRRTRTRRGGWRRPRPRGGRPAGLGDDP